MSKGKKNVFTYLFAKIIIFNIFQKAFTCKQFCFQNIFFIFAQYNLLRTENKE